MIKRTQNITLLIALLILPILSKAQVKVELNGKGNKTHTYVNNNGINSTELEYRGKIIFTDDETDVKYISPGGFIRFSKRSFGNRRTIELEADSNGDINRTYREGRTKMPFEPEGRQWMSSVLPEIIRTTGIGAEERVLKFYNKGGMTAVIDEIENLPSDYVQSKYYSACFALKGIDEQEVKQVLESAKDEISSSYEQSKLLRNGSNFFGKSASNLALAIKFVEDINSSYEQSKVYIHFIKNEDLSEANKSLIINGVGQINSSYEQSKVLSTLLAGELSTANIEAVIKVTGEINSSYEQSKVLQALIVNQQTDNIDFEVVLNAISNISSSYEQSKVLKLFVDKKELTSDQVVVLAKASTYISSDYDQSKFLQKLINTQDLDKESINAILLATGKVSSSYEKSKILQMMASSDNIRKANFAVLLEAASGISSSYDQSKVLAEMIELDNLTDQEQIALIKAIGDISSNYEKAKLLKAMAPGMSNSSSVHEIFLEEAKSLSDYDYGKVMRALNY